MNENVFLALRTEGLVRGSFWELEKTPCKGLFEELEFCLNSLRYKVRYCPSLKNLNEGDRFGAVLYDEVNKKEFLTHFDVVGAKKRDPIETPKLPKTDFYLVKMTLTGYYGLDTMERIENRVKELVEIEDDVKIHHIVAY